MLTTLKPMIETTLLPIAKVLKNVNPNAITLLGLIFPILFFLAVLHEQYALALVVFIFNGVDLLDGMVARANGKVTAFGGFLDSTIDRFADFTVIGVFGFAGLVSWSIIMPLILASFLISYIRSRIELAATKPLSGAVGLIERTERLIVVFIGLFLYSIFRETLFFDFNLIEVSFIILTILSFYTVGQRVLFAYRKL